MKTTALLACVLFAAAAGVARAQPAPQIVQVGGDGSAQVIGDFNITIITNDYGQKVYQVAPRHLAKIIRKAMRDELAARDAADAERDARIAELEDTQRRSDASHADELAALNARLLELDPPVRTRTEAILDESHELQEKVADLPPERRARAEAALADVDLYRARLELFEKTRAKTQYTNLGPVVAMAWERGADPGGLVGGVALDGARLTSSGDGGPVSVGMTGSGELTFGVAANRGGSVRRHAFALFLGPRLRLGREQGLLMQVGLYTPIVVKEAGDWRFPLIGAGAMIGYHRRFFHVDLYARYATSRVLYDDGHDTLFAGLGLYFFAPDALNTQR